MGGDSSSDEVAITGRLRVAVDVRVLLILALAPALPRGRFRTALAVDRLPAWPRGRDGPPAGARALARADDLEEAPDDGCRWP